MAGPEVLLKGAVAVADLASKIFGGNDTDQLGVAYPDSPLSSDELSKIRTAHRVAPAGHRAPDAPAVGEHGRRVTLFDEISYRDECT